MEKFPKRLAAVGTAVFIGGVVYKQLQDFANSSRTYPEAAKNEFGSTPSAIYSDTLHAPIYEVPPTNHQLDHDTRVSNSLSDMYDTEPNPEDLATFISEVISSHTRQQG